MRLESLAATLQIAVSEKCGEDTSQESLDGPLKEFPVWRGKPNVRPTCCPCLSKKRNLPATLSRGMPSTLEGGSVYRIRSFLFDGRLSTGIFS